MSNPVLEAKHFHNEEAAYAYLEARLWPNGPICPHCGGFERIGKLQGKSTRIREAAEICDASTEHYSAMTTWSQVIRAAADKLEESGN